MKLLILLNAVLGVVLIRASDVNFASIKRAAISYEHHMPLNDAPQLINGFFYTPLDHFAPLESRRLRLHYQSNVEFFEDDGPIFINLNNGQGSRWLTTGLVHDLARELGGAVVTADVRFQSRNWVTNTTKEILRFFTLEQVVSDVAQLVTKVKEDFDSPNSRVILFGNFLGGTAAVLARKRFPHLVDGVWSSGGVFKAAVPENTYFNSISWNIYHHGSNHCANALSTALRSIVKLVQEQNSTRLNELFNLCENIDLTNQQETQHFYRQVFSLIREYIHTHNYGGIRQICHDINIGTDQLRAFARWVNYVYDTDGKCRDMSYTTAVNTIRNEEDRIGSRIFTYFYCTQFGLSFLITQDNPPGNVFPNVINEIYHETLCRDAFDDTYNRTLLERAVNDFNIQNGAQNQVVTNAIFTHGALDPLLAHGIVDYNIDTSQAILTSLHDSLADLFSISDYDSADLLATKNSVLDTLRRFSTNVQINPGNIP